MVLRTRTMSTKVESDPTISRAFDRESWGYEARWECSPLVQFWRARVLGRVLAAVPPGGRIADLGGGTGADAVVLAAAGRFMRVADVSPGMVRVARSRGVDAVVADLADAPAVLGGGHDAVLANFGVLNCLPSLDGLGERVNGLVAPGGHVVLVWMSRHCPVDTLACLVRGRRPRRGRPSAEVGGLTVPLRWWSVAEVRAALPQGAEVLAVEAIGLFDPAPDLGGRLGRRSVWERRVATLPGLRALGDHTLLHARLPGRA